MMRHRTTFTLDRATTDRLQHLAMVWHVSQAEVVRRAIAMAAEQAQLDQDPAAALRQLHSSGATLLREQAEAYLADIREDRQQWRGAQ